MDLQLLGVFMIIPTVSVAFYITVKMRNFSTELFHNIAVCCWVMANSVWMIGEFFYDDTTRPYATVFFVSGVLVMTYYYLIHRRKLIRELKVLQAMPNAASTAAHRTAQEELLEPKH
jgi:hypothetical protein